MTKTEKFLQQRRKCVETGRCYPSMGTWPEACVLRSVETLRVGFADAEEPVTKYLHDCTEEECTEIDKT